MTSILTNSGAIVALQTLKATNKNLAMTQREISTGKHVNTAADGSAVWAVAKTMETDRDTFKTIQQGLNVASKVVSTAVENSDGIVDDLNAIKQRLTSSAKSDQDVEKNWDQIKELIDGIKAKISGSQINGVNLLNKQGTGDGATGTEKGQYTVLASLDRSYGNAQTSHTSITVESVDLQTAIADVLDTWADPSNAKEASALISGKPYFEHAEYSADHDRFTALSNQKVAFGETPSGANTARTKEEEAERNALITKYGGRAAAGTAAVAAVDTVADGTVAAAFITAASRVADQAALDAAGASALKAIEPDFNTYKQDYQDYDRIKAIAFGSRSTEDTARLNGLLDKYNGTTDGLATKGVAAVAASADFTTETAPSQLTAAKMAKSAYDADPAIVSARESAGKSVETLIDVATKAAAKLGAKQHRIESQEKSVGLIKDNLTIGIGALVDSNLEEASARLQALQTQQQLGIQSLSIANQAPGAVLSLFR